MSQFLLSIPRSPRRGHVPAGPAAGTRCSSASIPRAVRGADCAKAPDNRRNRMELYRMAGVDVAAPIYVSAQGTERLPEAGISRWARATGVTRCLERSRIAPDGALGLFHPLKPSTTICVDPIYARVQDTAGVASVAITKLRTRRSARATRLPREFVMDRLGDVAPITIRSSRARRAHAHQELQGIAIRDHLHRTLHMRKLLCRHFQETPSFSAAAPALPPSPIGSAPIGNSRIVAGRFRCPGSRCCATPAPATTTISPSRSWMPLRS